MLLNLSELDMPDKLDLSVTHDPKLNCISMMPFKGDCNEMSDINKIL